jgi:flavin-dependent dehydrogenase
MATFDETYEVIVVGGGNAGFSAATAAAQLGSRVLLVEKAPRSDAGGNTLFTAGAYRTCIGGLDDLLPIIYNEDGTKGLPKELVEKIDMKPYTPADSMLISRESVKGRRTRSLPTFL